MKLSGRDLTALIAKPDPKRAGLLLFGADAMRVALKRQDYLAKLLGPNAEDEMRLTRLNGADLRKDGASVQDAMRAVGFFPGQRAVLVDDANEYAAPALAGALQDWQEGDAHLVVTAGSLKATSKLRKAFESDRNAFAAGIYDDPPSRQEIADEMAKAGLAPPGAEAMQDLESLARVLDPGDFRQTLEKIAIYKLNDPSPLSSEEIALLVPATLDAEVDELLHVVAEGQTNRIGPLMARLVGQGIDPVFMCITALRHFKTLHAAVSDPKGAVQGISRVRPPVYGPRRDRMARQATALGQKRLEAALSFLTQTDLALRSAGQTAPQMAMVERMFIQLAHAARQQAR